MSDQSLSRRGALLAAASLGTAIAVADAQAQDAKSREADAPAKPKPFKLSVTLTDGQVVTFQANEATIDFGTAASLLVKSSGITPIVSKGPSALTPTPEPNRRREPDPDRLEGPFDFNNDKI